MAIVRKGSLNHPNVVCLSSDIDGGKIAGLQPGETAFLSDTGAWKICLADSSLADFSDGSVTVSNNITPGTAGTASTDVVSVQGIAGATPVPATDAGLGLTVTRTGFSSADASSTPVDLTGAPGASAKAVAMDIIVSVATACTVNFITESGSTIFSIYMAANSTVQLTPRGFIKGATNNKKLQATTSVASAISGICNWFTEA